MRLDLPQTACTDQQKHCDEAVETSYDPQYHDRGPNGERGCIIIYTHFINQPCEVSKPSHDNNAFY